MFAQRWRLAKFGNRCWSSPEQMLNKVNVVDCYYKSLIDILPLEQMYNKDMLLLVITSAQILPNALLYVHPFLRFGKSWGMIVCPNAAGKRRASKALWQVGFCGMGFVCLPMCLTCCVGNSVSLRKEIAKEVWRFVICPACFIVAVRNIYFVVTKIVSQVKNIIV